MLEIGRFVPPVVLCYTTIRHRKASLLWERGNFLLLWSLHTNLEYRINDTLTCMFVFVAFGHVGKREWVGMDDVQIVWMQAWMAIILLCFLLLFCLCQNPYICLVCWEQTAQNLHACWHPIFSKLMFHGQNKVAANFNYHFWWITKQEWK